MERKILVSYWLCGREHPDDHVFTLKDVTNFQIPMILKEKIADYETYREEAYDANHVTIINFWEIE